MRGQPSPYAGKKVLVVGLGLHGGAASAVRWLVRHGAQVRVIDQKSAAVLRPSLRLLQGLNVTYHLGGHRPADFSWADIIYQNQGVPSTLPELRSARRRKVPIINEVTIFFSRCLAPIVGVTGTRGKSTTTALIGEMLKRHFPRTVVTGNIRQTPMLDLLDRLSSKHLVVMELSSFQLEFLPLVQRSPRVAVMTNLKVDHLNRYSSVASYARAKYQIFRYQTSGDVAILNYESSWTRRAAKLTRGRVVWFSARSRPTDTGVWLADGKVMESRGKKSRSIGRLPKYFELSQPRQENYLAAVAAARAFGVPVAAIQRAGQAFRGLPHRQELIRRWHGHQFINDTAATTPDAILAALEVWPKGLYIIGGADKQLKFQRLAQRLTRLKIRMVLLPGSATKQLLKALQGAGYPGQVAEAKSMSAAVRRAVRLAEPHQPIILSPGAASFGLFQHEFDRGEQFIQAVKRLPV